MTFNDKSFPCTVPGCTGNYYPGSNCNRYPNHSDLDRAFGGGQTVSPSRINELETDTSSIVNELNTAISGAYNHSWGDGEHNEVTLEHVEQFNRFFPQSMEDVEKKLAKQPGWPVLPNEVQEAALAMAAEAIPGKDEADKRLQELWNKNEPVNSETLAPIIEEYQQKRVAAMEQWIDTVNETVDRGEEPNVLDMPPELIRSEVTAAVLRSYGDVADGRIVNEEAVKQFPMELRSLAAEKYLYDFNGNYVPEGSPMSLHLGDMNMSDDPKANQLAEIIANHDW